MRIGELAQRVGTTAKTLRFYEEKGLLPAPTRTRSGYRDYPEDAVDRLLFVQDAQKAGFTLGQIGQVLDIRDGGEPPCGHVSQLITQRLKEVERRIADLQHARTRLLELARRTEQIDPTDCDGYCAIIQRGTVG